MNKLALLTLAGCLLAGSAPAHERITLGPGGGRVVYLDSPAIPHLEFRVDEEKRAHITLLDAGQRPMDPGSAEVTVTAGPRASARRLKTQPVGGSLVSEPLPAGAPYTVVLQMREKAGSRPLTARIDYDPRPAPSGKPTYLDDSVNENSGPSLKPPADLPGLFAEINQHHEELKEGFSGKKYEALDEVTQAFAVLLKALQERSQDKGAAVARRIDDLLAHLKAIGEANAHRTLGKAAEDLKGFNAGLAELKKAFPAEVANSRL